MNKNEKIFDLAEAYALKIIPKNKTGPPSNNQFDDTSRQILTGYIYKILLEKPDLDFSEIQKLIHIKDYTFKPKP